MRDRFKRFNAGRAVLFLVALIAFFMTCAVLKLSAVVILPFVVALFLTFVLTPLVNLLEKKFKIPRLVSVLLAGISVIAGLLVILALVYQATRSILEAFPRYEQRITEIYIWLAGFFELSYNEELSILQNLWAQLGIRSRIQYYTVSFSNSFLVFLKDAVMVALFVVFLLLEAVHIKEKLTVAFEGKWAGQIRRISTDIMWQVSRYLSIKFFLSLLTGLTVAVLLHIVGVEFAAVWGIIQFVLNFIPTLGSIAIGVTVPVFAMIQFWPDPGPVIWTIIIMLGTNMIIGNALEPKIMGDRLGLSPVTVLLALVVWGWIWGFAGMVIAVPMMVIIKIICENVTILEPVSILLGSRRSVLAKKAEYEKEEQRESSCLQGRQDGPQDGQDSPPENTPEREREKNSR